MFMIHNLMFQKFNPVAVSSDKYGQFHIGDSYVVLKVSVDS